MYDKDVAIGRGCSHCPTGYPITRVNSKSGKIRLCYECTMRWFPQADPDWFEAHHAPFKDHTRRKEN